MKTIHIAAFLLCLAMIAVPSAAAKEVNAPAMYFEPAHIIGTFGEETTIDLMITTDEVVDYVQAEFRFNPECINITDVNFTGCAWQPSRKTGWVNRGYYIALAATADTGVSPGVHKIATITVDCVSCDGKSSIMIYETIPSRMAQYMCMFTCTPATPMQDMLHWYSYRVPNLRL